MEETNQFNEQPQQTEESNTFSFVSEEEVQQLTQQSEPQLQQETQPEPDAEPQGTNEYTQETYNDSSYQEPVQYSSEDIEGAVLNFLSERLGRDLTSFDDLQQQQREYDERVLAIADFVEKTGRDPQDWFYYQSLNPSEMDDTTAIQMQMLSEYPNLSQEEVSLLISSKYKLDPSLNTEEEVRLSQLQLKIDAESARKNISEIRESYAAPQRQEQSFESPIDDQWVSQMSQELNDLEAIEFDLGNGKTFNFGLRNEYKSQLADKNARLDEYFNSYVRQDGSWDFDKLNIHRAAIDNIDMIVQSAYKQGMSDGQRGIVERSANVNTSSPQVGATQPDTISQQLREAMGMGNGMTFL